MGRKTILEPYKLLNNVSIATNVTSAASNVRQLDQVNIELEWNTGSSLSGTVYVDMASLLKDGSQSIFKTLDFGSLITISGASGTHQITLNAVPFDLIQVRYVSSAGTGNMTVIVSGKVLGA